MKINLKTTKLISIKGETLQEQVVNEKGDVLSVKDIELKDLLTRALTHVTKEDERTTKEKDFEILLKIFNAKEDILDLESEQISRLKTKVSMIYDPWIMGQINLILEGKTI